MENSSHKIRTPLWKKLSLIMGSVAFTLILVEVFLQVWSGIYLYVHHRANSAILNSENEIRIMCIGESTTAIGFGNSYPQTLERTLNKEFPHKRFVVINEGVSGTNTEWILETLEQKILKYRPHMVITMMGINDYWNLVVRRNRPENDTLFDQLYSRLKIVKMVDLALINLKNRENIQSQHNTEKIRLNLEDELKNLPNNPQAHLAMAKHYFDQKNFGEALKHFQNGLSLHKGQVDLENYRLLGITYLQLNDKLNAEKYFDLYAEQSQDRASALAQIGSMLFGDNKLMHVPLVLKYFSKSIALGPNPEINAQIRRILIEIYSQDPAYRNFELTKKYYDEMLEMGRNEVIPLDYLADVAIRNKLVPLAIEYLKRGIETIDIQKDPNNEWIDKIRLWNRLILAYDLDGKSKLADETEKVAREKFPHVKGWDRAPSPENYFAALERKFDGLTTVALDDYKVSVTKRNYLRSVEIIKKHGIIPVAMQYPNRDITSLKEMLSGEEGIIFVDNNHTFKEALRKMNFEDLFVDHFAGDTGHFTALGAQMIADQIVKTFRQEKLFQAILGGI